MRPGRRSLLAVLAVLAVVPACDDDPVALVPCVLESVFTRAAVAHVTDASLVAVLDDALDRSGSALVGSDGVAELRAALSELTSTVTTSEDEACRGVLAARERLAALPDDAATLPDRTVVALALDLAEAHLNAR